MVQANGPKCVLSGVKSFNRIWQFPTAWFVPPEKPIEIPHILVAEDDLDTRELVEMVLRRAEFRVTSTGDPYEVLELLASYRFDALLLDNWMPKLNGIELCRLIRSTNDDVVIVFCSGAVAESDKQAAFAAGAQAFIGKPFLPQELTATLSSALNITSLPNN
jgi:DNA-binding response OmpR family regulator